MHVLASLMRWIAAGRSWLALACRTGLARLALRLRCARLWVVMPGRASRRPNQIVLPFSLAGQLRRHADETGQPLEDLLAGVLSAAIQNSLPPDPVELAWRSLTEREREVAALMAQGLTNPAIAVRLTITLNTVRTHAQRVLRKFGCRRRYELPACLQDKLENLGIHPEIPEGPMTGH